MRCNGIAHFGVFNVLHPKLLAGLFNNFAYLRIMDMRYFGEQMMLNLEIKTTHIKCEQSLATAEVGRCELLFARFYISEMSLTW